MRINRGRGVALSVALAVVLTVTGCSVTSRSSHAGSSDIALPSAARVSAPPARVVHAAPLRRGAAKAAHSHVRAGLVLLAGGVVLPNRRRTPGAINPRVTQSDIHSTICVRGFTATERPASSYTTSLKVRQLATGYALHRDRRTSDYEEDHLISLELGGSATSPRNLWPEPYAGREGARVKDRIENKLHDLVCAGVLPLRAAQRAIASNWWRAYERYISTRVPRRAVPHRRPAAPPPAVVGTVRHSCTTTSSGSCIRGGAFCPQADYGMTSYDAGGTAYTCTGDTTHPHWE